VHQRLDDVAVEKSLKPCPCGGSFTAAASPRRPHCRQSLSPVLAKKYIEANAPGTHKGWTWQENWDGIYAIIIDNQLVEDWWMND
jgi:hypothetical protein